MATAVDTAVSTVRHHMQSAWNNPVDRNDVKTAVDALRGLNAADTRAAIGRLSADELRQLADEINDGSWFGLGGLNQGEKTDLFNEMARDLGGAELAKLSQAFDRSQGWQTANARLGAVEDVASLARAVGQHGSAQTQKDFIAQLAAGSTDQTSVDTSGDSRMYDPQARAIAEVLGGMGSRPQAAQEALASLSPEQRQAVIRAASQETIRVGGAMGGVGAVIADPAPLRQLLKVTAGMADADLKARVFADASAEMKRLQGRGLGHEAEQVRQGLRELLLSDVNGVMRELSANRETSNGSALASFIKSSLNAKDFDGLGEVQAQLALGNGKNQSPVTRFEAQVTSPSGAPRYVNAETAGYYAGALSAAVTSITSDAKQQGDLINAVLKSVLTVVDKTVGRAVPAVGIGASVLKEWTQFGVKAAMDMRISDQVSMDDKIFQALVPMQDTRTLPNGQIDSERAAGSDATSAFNSTWINIREHANP